MKNHTLKIARIIIIIYTAVTVMSLSACSDISQLEKQAIISAIGIDTGENARFSVSAQVFQVMGAGSATPVDSSQSNTIIVSAEGDTVAQCMDKISLILGRKTNTGHNKYIVIGSGALSIPLSESLNYFIRSEQTYLGVPVICSEGSARDIINVKLQNEVETAMAVDNIIKHAVASGEAIKVDLLKIANSDTVALPVLQAKPPKEQEGEDIEKEVTSLFFSGTRIVRDGKLIYTASQRETEGYCWLEGTLDSMQLCVYPDGRPLGVLVTMTGHKDTMRRSGDGSYEMVYRIKARIKLLDSFGGDADGICGLVEETLEEQCAESFLRLSQYESADFLDVRKTANSLYPVSSRGESDLFSKCGVSVDFVCTLDK